MRGKEICRYGRVGLVCGGAVNERQAGKRTKEELWRSKKCGTYRTREKERVLRKSEKKAKRLREGTPG